MTSTNAEQALDLSKEAQTAAKTPAESSSTSTQNTDSYILNHIAIKVSSVSASKAFYADLFGMKEIFTVETGRFTAHYLGSVLHTGESSQEMLSSLGTRSALLELITDQPSDLCTGASGSDQTTQHINTPDQENPFGFVHLGFRVPDVAEIIARARKSGYTILKDVDELDVTNDILPGRLHAGGKSGEWRGEFKDILARIAFVADPDIVSFRRSHITEQERRRNLASISLAAAKSTNFAQTLGLSSHFESHARADMATWKRQLLPALVECVDSGYCRKISSPFKKLHAV